SRLRFTLNAACGPPIDSPSKPLRLQVRCQRTEAQGLQAASPWGPAARPGPAPPALPPATRRLPPAAAARLCPFRPQRQLRPSTAAHLAALLRLRSLPAAVGLFQLMASLSVALPRRLLESPLEAHPRPLQLRLQWTVAWCKCATRHVPRRPKQ
ncbi:uncharacterized protein Tco025E_08854, partial [Trypanosoma conorhini]